MKPSEVALAAKDVILDHGWVQGDFFGPNGEVCLSAAIRMVGWQEGDSLVHKAVRARTGLDAAFRWNDQPGRTKQEVLDLLDDVARDLKEQEQLMKGTKNE